MAQKVRIIKGPVVPGQTSGRGKVISFGQYTMYLYSGIIVTNPDQFPPEETVVEEEGNPKSPVTGGPEAVGRTDKTGFLILHELSYTWRGRPALQGPMTLSLVKSLPG